MVIGIGSIASALSFLLVPASLADALRPTGIGVALLAVFFVLRMIFLRPVLDPNRALVFRMATLHRVAGPGYIVVVPLLERLDSELDMGERESRVKLAAAHTADGTPLTPCFDITWRIAPEVRGKPPRVVRTMLLMPEERRAKLVEEVVSRAARRTINAYGRIQLARAETRDSAALTMAFEANDELEHRGLVVERVFWRA
ncbi:MAG: SPFH domain-containing protein [Ktedonobacterales bacterium]